MATVDVAALTLAVSQLCGKMAFGLLDFVHKVKEAPEQAHQMQMSLAALSKCLDKVYAVCLRPRQFDGEEEKYRNSIIHILRSIQLDLETIEEKLRLDEFLEQQRRGFWHDAINTFHVRFEGDDIKEIHLRMESNQRVLQTYFEMLLLLSSWKTQDGITQLTEVVKRVLVSLLEDTNRIPSRSISKVAAYQQDDAIWGNPDDQSMVCGSDDGSVLSSQHDDAVKAWQAISTDLVGILTGNKQQQRQPPSPPAFDSNVPDLLIEDLSSPRSSISRITRPEDHAEKDRLKRSFTMFRDKAATNLETDQLLEAAEFQQKAIDVVSQLKLLEPFPLDQVIDTKERLAEIHVKMGSGKDLNKALEILRDLAVEEDARGVNGSLETRGRLYQSLCRTELRLGMFSDAYDSGKAAAYSKLEANPDISTLSLDDAERIKEAAQLCYQAAMQIPDSSKATSTFYDITHKLGCPDLCPPVMVNVGQIRQWCKSQGFDVDSKDFWYDRCDTTGTEHLKGFSPIHQAIKMNAIDELSGMLAYPCSLEQRLTADYDDPTPLLLACSKRNDEAVALLVDKGARADATSRGGLNALHRCQSSVWGGTDIARRLLQQGYIHIDDKDDLGRTALHLAAQTGNEDMIRFLLGPDGGANPNAQQVDGSTPAKTALLSSIHNKVGVIKILMKHKNTDLDTAQRTLIGTARSMQDREVVRYLESLATSQVRRTSKASGSSSGGCSCPHCGVHALSPASSPKEEKQQQKSPSRRKFSAFSAFSI